MGCPVVCLGWRRWANEEKRFTGSGKRRGDQHAGFFWEGADGMMEGAGGGFTEVDVDVLQALYEVLDCTVLDWAGS